MTRIHARKAAVVAGAWALSLGVLVGSAAAREVAARKVPAQEVTAQEVTAQEAPAERARTRAVVVGDDGRILELHTDEGSSVRFGPEVVRDDVGNVVVLEQLGLGRGFLGVQLIGLTEQLRVRFRVPEGEGALVSEVVEGSPAERAGVRAGDVITAVGTEPVRRTGDVRRLVAERDGELVDLEVFRDGAPLRLTATVVERRRPLVKVRRDGDQVHLEWIGGGTPEELDAERGRFFFDDALEGLELYFESDEWRERTDAASDAEGDEDLDTVTIELRIDAVKKQLDEVRTELEKIRLEKVEARKPQKKELQKKELQRKEPPGSGS